MSKIKNQEQIKFDLQYNKLQYETKLEYVYNKEYIYNNIIYSDDTIHTIKKKICLSININLRIYIFMQQ